MSLRLMCVLNPIYLEDLIVESVDFFIKPEWTNIKFKILFIISCGL